MNTQFQARLEEKYVWKTWKEIPENVTPKFSVGETVYLSQDGFYYEVKAINYLGKDGEKDIFEYQLEGYNYPVFEDQLNKLTKSELNSFSLRILK